MESAIYEGSVRHRRTSPRENAFRYRLCMLYLDLSELDTVFEGRALWSVGRGNLASFRRRDYLGDPHKPLDAAVRDVVFEKTGSRPTGPVRMLTQIRYFGYVFNPVTFYYCFDEQGRRPVAIVVHITNTPWKERHAYVFDVGDTNQLGSRAHHRFAKEFHVSPFMPMELDYDWRFSAPGHRLWVDMRCLSGSRRTLDATLALRRRPISRRGLARVLLRHPLMTWKVTAAIHVQALRLWLKGIAFHVHPRKRRASQQVR